MCKFNDKLLNDYMKNFLGYGSIDADYWFVGMEEGGGDSFEEISRRISTWENRGESPLEDLYEYHRDIGIKKWFENNASIQPTWNRLIRILLSFKGIQPDRDIVRRYQINKLGRSSEEVCMLELLPLPSPNTTHWMYNEYSDLPFLETRQVYTDTVGPKRANYIHKLIQEKQPKFVIFYGIGYMNWWREVLKIELKPIELCNKRTYIGKLDNTMVAVSQHPVAQGVSLDYFHKLGNTLSQLSANTIS